jgi:hypothetical protein
MVIQTEQIQSTTATAANDALTAPFGTISTVNVLSNDDFLPVASNVITRTGGTASGTVVLHQRQVS